MEVESERSYQRIFGSVLWSEIESQWDRKTAIKEKKKEREKRGKYKKTEGEKFTEEAYKLLKLRLEGN